MFWVILDSISSNFNTRMKKKISNIKNIKNTS